MKSRPVAVVVVTYNSADVILDCLRSIRSTFATGEQPKVIVVDNASSDRTTEIVVTAAPYVTLFRRQSNDGFGAAVNAGIELCDDCDVLVLNADIRLEARTISALQASLSSVVGITVPRLVDDRGQLNLSLRRAPTARRTIGEAIIGGAKAGRFETWGETVTDAAVYERAGLHDWATGAVWMISRECLDATGNLEERYLLYSEETDFMLRSRQRGYHLCYLPEARAVHIEGQSRTSPQLWSLLVTNKVRLHRERFGLIAAIGMWLAVFIDNLVRAALGSPTHRRALRDLLVMRRWPEPLATRNRRDRDMIMFAGNCS